MIILRFSIFSRFGEQNLCTIRERTSQAAVTNLAADELFIIGGRSFGIQMEGILALGSQSRVKPQIVPVASRNRVLDLGLGLAHARRGYRG